MPRATSGVLDGNIHLFPIRVYYEETDAGRMAHHAVFLKYAERARTEMMRMAGLQNIGLMADGELLFTVHSVDIRYIEQARLDDELMVRTRVTSSKGASITMNQLVFRIASGTSGDAIAEIDLRMALVDNSGRPRRFPAQIKAVLDDLRDEEG